MKNLLACLLAIVAIGCVQGNIEPLDICSSKELPTIPVTLAAGQPFSVGYVTRNTALSEALAKMKDFGDVSVNLTSATFSTKEKVDLSFVTKIQIGFVNPDDTILPLGESTSIDGDKIVYQFGVVPETVRQALLDGPVKFHTTVSGVLPSVNVTPTFVVCANASSTIDTSISDLKK